MAVEIAALKAPLKLKPKQLARFITEHRLLAHLSVEQRGIIRKILIEVETENGKQRNHFRPSNCYANSQMLALRGGGPRIKNNRITYVEGIHGGDGFGYHHAWNRIEGQQFDITACINIAAISEDSAESVDSISAVYCECTSNNLFIGKEFSWDEVVNRMCGTLNFSMMMTDEEAFALARPEITKGAKAGK